MMILYVANDIMFIIGLRQYNRMKKGVEQDTKGWQCRTNTGKEDRACEKIRERSFIMLSGKYQKEQIELEQQITSLREELSKMEQDMIVLKSGLS